MQTATSETESKSRDLSICVHHYTVLKARENAHVSFLGLAPYPGYFRERVFSSKSPTGLF